MTYTDAVNHNKQFNLPNTWKDPKSIGDGKSLRWVQDTNGLIGYLRTGERYGKIIVCYPTKVLKASVYLTTQCWNADEFKNFKKLP